MQSFAGGEEFDAAERKTGAELPAIICAIAGRRFTHSGRNRETACSANPHTHFAERRRRGRKLKRRRPTFRPA